MRKEKSVFYVIKIKAKDENNKNDEVIEEIVKMENKTIEEINQIKKEEIINKLDLKNENLYNLEIFSDYEYICKDNNVSKDYIIKKIEKILDTYTSKDNLEEFLRKIRKLGSEEITIKIEKNKKTIRLMIDYFNDDFDIKDTLYYVKIGEK